MMIMNRFIPRSAFERFSLIVWVVLLIIFVAFAECRAVPAQSTAAILSGVVVDESGAVVPEVRITLLSSGTGLQRHAVTGNDGYFSIPLLAAGDYTLTAELPGFTTVTVNDIALQAGVNSAIQIILKPKAIAESMDVLGRNSIGAPGSQINLSSNTSSYSMNQRQIVSLPVFTSDAGRNAMGVFPFSVPGVIPTSVFGAAETHVNFYGNQMSINGSRPNSISFYLDGGDNNDPELNRAAMPPPNPDALGEFTIVTNNYQADLGSSSGGIVSAVVKSGTEKFTGSLRYYLINEALNARGFFDPSVPADKLDTFGGQLGGPVLIPGLPRPRANFFFDYEGTRSNRGAFSNLTLLSDKERAGDFSDLPPSRQPRDPVTRKFFSGGIIPPFRIDPIAQTYLKRYVPVATNGVRNYSESLLTTLQNDQITSRLDYEVNSADHLSATYFSNQTASDADSATLPLGSKTSNRDINRTLVLRESHVFSPETINQFTGTLYRLAYSVTNFSPGATGVHPSEIGFTGIHPQSGKFLGIPSVSIDGTNVRISTGGGGDNNKTSWQIKDDLSTVFGNHGLKMGGALRGFLQNASVGNNNGSFNFSPSNFFASGNQIADFLLGIPTRYTQTTGETTYPRQRAFYLYSLDEWRIRPNLLINLGLRYELSPPFGDKFDQGSVFRPGYTSSQFPSATRGLLFVGDRDPVLGTVPGGLYPTDRNNFAPRFGLSYSPKATSPLLRLLFGDGKSAIRVAAGVFYDQTFGAFFTEVASTQPFSVIQSFNAGQLYVAGATFANPFGKQKNSFPIVRNQPLFFGVRDLQPIDPSFRTAYTYQYNVTFQRELPGSLLLEGAYVGNSGFKLSRQRQLNLNVGGSQVDRRYPDFGNIRSQESSGRSRYDSLQLRIKRRLKGGLMFEGSYVLQRSLDDGSGPLGDTTTPLLWGRSEFDRRHNFVMSYSYEVPTPHLSGFARSIAEGWQIGGITELRSGLPMDFFQSNDSTLTGQSIFSRPDLVGPFVRFDPRHERTVVVDGVPQTGHFLFDPSAFRVVTARTLADARPGTLGRNVFDGPGLNLWSVSINKRIHLAGSQHLNFRADIRNLFNHANFQVPLTEVDGSPTFGQVVQAAPGRNVQLSLRYSF